MTTPGAIRTTLLGLSALALVTVASLPTAGCNAIAGIDLPDNDDYRPGGGSSGGSGGGSTGPGTYGAITVVESGCGAENLQIDERLIAGCMLRASCDPLTPPYSISLCVTIAAQTTGPTENCTYGATSCSQVWSCIGRSPLAVAGWRSRAAGDVEWVCDGDIATFCSPAYTYSVDCTTLGANCNDEHASAYPAMGPCTIADADTYGVPCTGDEPASPPVEGSNGYFSCDGDVLTYCDDGTRYAVNCSAQGNVCTDLGDGSAYCSDRPEPCSPASSYSCDGSSIDACDAQGYSETYDCGPAGLACEEVGSSVACVAEGCSTAGSCFEQCVNDTTIQFCQGGSPVTLDCVAFGFTGCEELENGSITIARCTGGNGILVDDSCTYANDGVCDESTYCDAGTDSTDCLPYRGTCGSTNTDLSYENDGECDVPVLCENGSDLADCFGVDPASICCTEDNACDLASSSACDCPGVSWETDC